MFKSLVSFIRNLKYIFKPSFWCMNESYCGIVDAILRDVIDNDRVVKFDNYRAITDNGLKLWVANYPYSFGMPSKTKHARASRYQIERFNKYLANHVDRYSTQTIL